MPIFRRSILVETRATEAEAEVEDDFHRFGVRIRHDGETILDITGREWRTPWNTCRHAGRMLSALNGVRLRDNASDFSRQNDPHVQCTHMYELAAITSANIVRGVRRRRYDAIVPYPLEGEGQARLLRDGTAFLEWTLARDPDVGGSRRRSRIVGPAPFAGQDLSSVLRVMREDLDPDTYEAAYVLRRAIGLASARWMQLDSEEFRRPHRLFNEKLGDCFTFQPRHADVIRRIVGSTRDFTDVPGDLLKDRR